eukprot:CAMPEP_0178766186 /NCGR_PEP_ID=MMETSP0744-20121128/18908_1 /TAXON_ID=913974 /ORGANISM="Nitzschia punctata, Strain CCMP561" /LENGTH=144 /DNA_ID=CAMNT_0020421847 /DNA_START=235 /DNA_END=666 /DNA_ORIENTATION=-
MVWPATRIQQHPRHEEKEISQYQKQQPDDHHNASTGARNSTKSKSFGRELVTNRLQSQMVATMTKNHQFVSPSTPTKSPKSPKTPKSPVLTVKSPKSPILALKSPKSPIVKSPSNSKKSPSFMNFASASNKKQQHTWFFQSNKK